MLPTVRGAEVFNTHVLAVVGGLQELDPVGLECPDSPLGVWFSRVVRAFFPISRALGSGELRDRTCHLNLPSRLAPEEEHRRNRLGREVFTFSRSSAGREMKASVVNVFHDQRAVVRNASCNACHRHCVRLSRARTNSLEEPGAE